MSESANCRYCEQNPPDYDIDCPGCRTRFNWDHHHERFAAAKKLEYKFTSDTSILQVQESKG